MPIPPSVNLTDTMSKGYSPSNPNIRKTNSYNVTYHFDDLKHNQNIIFDSLFAEFEDYGMTHGFSIVNKLNVGNIANLIEGILNVKVIKDED